MAMTPDGSPESKRGAKRDSLLLMAELRDQDGRALGQARIRNLSATGLMAEIGSAPGIVVGAILDFDLRNIGPVSAQVAWVRTGKIGLVFTTPIDPQAVRRPVGSGVRAVAPTATSWQAANVKASTKGYKPG